MRVPKEKRERSLGLALQVKGARSAGPKAAIVRKPYPPGMHGQKKARGMKAMSDFGRQIKEKLKCKVSYGIDDAALRQIFRRAVKKSGSTAANLMELLEGRLDNVIYRLRFAPSRGMARQLITQGHIMVNKKRVRSPGYQVSLKDIVSIRPESAGKGPFRELAASLEKLETAPWLKLDLQKMEGHVIGKPENPAAPFEINLLVESFSK